MKQPIRGAKSAAVNVHDSCERDTLLLGDEAALYADAAYSSKETRDVLERFGIAAIAHNIQKAAKFLALYGIREPLPTG